MNRLFTFSPGVHFIQPGFPLRPDYSGLRFNFLLLPFILEILNLS